MTIRSAGSMVTLDLQTSLFGLDPIAVAGLDTSELLPSPQFTVLPTAALRSQSPGTSAVANNPGTLSTIGAAVMNVPSATATYHVTGTGIRIGILSDSFNAQGGAAAEESNGDLPSTVDILSDYTGPGATDEGRAMAELVHAVAPGAAIDFATANVTDQAFAAGILALAAAGCSIIVDDVTYFDEPFFEDSNVIQKAVETVIAEGVSYFTAASNEGTNFYQAAVDMVSGTLTGVSGTMFENFGATAAGHSGSDILQDISITTGTTLTFDLQWTQPFLDDGTTNQIGPGSAYSLALYLFDPSGNLVTTSVIGGNGISDVTGQDPVQLFQFKPSVSGTYQLAIGLNGGTPAAGGTLKYIVYDSYAIINNQPASLLAIEDSNAGQNGGAITGHELVAGANTVGAVPASAPTAPEVYSSFGPGTLDTFNATGTLTGSVTETKPDMLAPDGIATSVSGFSQFFGTSAAAPDAAAVAALMLQANPNLTPTQVTAILQSTATVVSGDTNQVGAGLVNAHAAVAAANGDVWIQSGGGTWDTASVWSKNQAPGTSDPATLSNDFGTLTTSYKVTVATTDAVAATLTVGNATSASVRPGVTLAINAGDALSIVTGATVTQKGTVIVAGTGTLIVGGIAFVGDSTAALTLQNHAVMTTGELELSAGVISVGANASLTVTGSTDLEITVTDGTNTTYEAIPYGLATGGGSLTVGNHGLLQVTGGGGVLVEGSMVINANGTVADSNSGGVAFLLLGGTLTDNGTLTEANALLVNTAASLTVGAGGVLTTASLDIEGSGASVIVNGQLTNGGALTDSGALTVGSLGKLTMSGTGGLQLGGSMTIDAGGTLTDRNSSHATFVISGGTLTDNGILTEANALLVNAAGSLTVGTNGVLTAADLDVEDASVAINGQLTDSGDLTDNGVLTVGSRGMLTLSGTGGLQVGGSLTIDVGGTFTDTNTSHIAFVLSGGTLVDNGVLTEATALLVNAAGTMTVGTGGAVTAASLDVEGTGARITVNGQLTDNGDLTGAASGRITVGGTGVLSISGVMEGPGIALGAGTELTGGGTLILETSSSSQLLSGLTSVITIEGDGASIDLSGLIYSTDNLLVPLNNDTLVGSLTIEAGGTTLVNLQVSNFSGHALELRPDGNNGTVITAVACYRSGTRIATPSGEMPIETLRIGDPILTASGKVRLVHWIGRRHHTAEEVARERLVQPVRIHAEALGPLLPRRNLDVSPQHALLLQDEAGEVLIPACKLINGVSIIRLPADGAVTYLHIELEDHDALLAEGQPAETFVDNEGGRSTFENASEYVSLYPEKTIQPISFCTSRIEDGPVLARIREKIDARAGLQPGPLSSAVDHIDRQVIEGWAYDAANPHCPILLEVLVNGRPVGTVLADRHRADLAATSGAAGYCGFDFRLSAWLQAGQRHVLSVRRVVDGVELYGTPAIIDRKPPADALLRHLLAIAPDDDMTGFLAMQIDRLRVAMSTQ